LEEEKQRQFITLEDLRKEFDAKKEALWRIEDELRETKVSKQLLQVSKIL